MGSSYTGWFMQENAGMSLSRRIAALSRCGSTSALHIFHLLFPPASTVYLYIYILFPSQSHSPLSTATMNNPAISNLILSLGAMQGTFQLEQRGEPQLTQCSRPKDPHGRPTGRKLPPYRLRLCSAHIACYILLHYPQGKSLVTDMWWHPLTVA